MKIFKHLVLCAVAISLVGCASNGLPAKEHLEVRVIGHYWGAGDVLEVSYVVTNRSAREICLVHPFELRNEQPATFLIRKHEGEQITGYQPGDPSVSIAPQPNTRVVRPILFEPLEPGESMRFSANEQGYFHLNRYEAYQIEILVTGAAFCDRAFSASTADDGLVRLTGLTDSPTSRVYRSQVYMID